MNTRAKSRRSLRIHAIAGLALTFTLSVKADTLAAAACTNAEINEWIKQEHIFSTITPKYPPMARRLGQQGKVVLNITLDNDRRIEDIYLSELSGHKALDEGVVKIFSEKIGSKLNTPACVTEGQKLSLKTPLVFRIEQSQP